MKTLRPMSRKFILECLGMLTDKGILTAFAILTYFNILEKKYIHILKCTEISLHRYTKLSMQSYLREVLDNRKLWRSILLNCH